MIKMKGAAVIGQSGGPTAAINATLAGAIRGAIKNKDIITDFYGMRNGIEGLMGENLIDLFNVFTKNGEADEEKLSLLETTPAAALGSCRKKLPLPEESPEFYENLVSIFKKYNIRYFFYIGGNDSMDTVAKLSSYTNSCGYEMRVVGLPKTIDNDLCGTDHTPGYGSASKYIATTMLEIIRDCAVYTIPAVTIVEIMGRDAGWLTASAALPRIICGSAPDFVYLPEKAFSQDEFIADLKVALKLKPNIVVAVSEGLRDNSGKYVGEGTQSGALDVFGHKYLAGTAKALELLVKEQIGCKVRSIELNLPQRCAAHIASLTDISESAGSGEYGVNAAIDGNSGFMVSFLRDEESGLISYEAADVSAIANKVKLVPDEFINKRGNNVTDSCLKYILPLIIGETKIKYKDGIPTHFVF